MSNEEKQKGKFYLYDRKEEVGIYIKYCLINVNHEWIGFKLDYPLTKLDNN